MPRVLSKLCATPVGAVSLQTARDVPTKRMVGREGRPSESSCSPNRREFS